MKIELMKQGIIITLAALFLLAACRRAKTENEEHSSKKNIEKAETREQNIIKKRISIPFDFSYITSLGSVDIIYTQGNYSIEVEGDSAVLNYLKAEFDSNLLTVSLQSDNNSDINLFGNAGNVKMYVSAPTLKCVSICANGSFESQATWRGEDIQVGVLGTGSMKLGKVECTTFSLQSTDIGDINVTDLHADDATLYSCSSANIDVNMDVKNLVVINEGTQKFHLKGKAGNVMFKKPNDMNLTNDLK